MVRCFAQYPQNGLFVHVHDACRCSHAHAFCQASSDGFEARFLQVRMMEGSACSRYRPRAGRATKQCPFGIYEQSSNTVSSYHAPHVPGRMDTAIEGPPPNPFVETLDGVPWLQKLLMRLFERVDSHDEMVRAPLLPSRNFSTTLSTVRLEHSIW